MSGKGRSVSPRVKKAVSLITRMPELTVPQALRAAKYTTKKSKDVSLQMQVRRRLPSTKKQLKKQTPSAPATAVATQSPESTVSSITTSTDASVSASSGSNNFEDVTYPRPKKDQDRSTAAKKQKKRAAKKRSQGHASKVHKHATLWYARQKQLPVADRLSAAQIAKKVRDQSEGVGPSARTIQRYVAAGLAGCSPKKMGNPGTIPDFVFQTLCTAFQTFVTIQQINGRGGEIDRAKLRRRINRLMAKDDSNLSYKLLDRVIAETAMDLVATKTTEAEHRRILWTTYRNLKMWFLNWKEDLLRLGFASYDDDGDVIITPEQLARIINLDETCLSLDSSNGNRGGRPTVTFFDPRFPNLGKGTSKSSLTTTMIGGSNALGEALPPHFQFQTSATSVDRERIRAETAMFMPYIWGKFGEKDAKEWPVTFGLNEKGGMDDAEFEKYIIGSITPLYMDAADEDGKRVMIKVDSGPGRIQADLLARLRMMGFILYPGVPNTTAVSQETDRNYGPFKTQFRKNLAFVVDVRIDADITVSLQPWMVGLIVFGGTDPNTGYVVADSAFEAGFSSEQCLRAWAKIGAAPLTMACLNDPKVRREKSDDLDGDGSSTDLMQEIEDANSLAVYQLTERGYVGSFLEAKLMQRKTQEPVTRPHTQERIELLADAHTHGAKFIATGGSHLTTDDFFKSVEIPKRRKEVERITKDKDARVLKQKYEEEARAVLDRGIPFFAKRGWSVPQLNAVLFWYGKTKTECDAIHKPEKLALVKHLLNNQQPPAYDKWTSADEEHLQELKKMKIDMKDTALGRLEATKKRELSAAVPKMSQEERAQLRRKLDELDTVESTAV